MIKVLIVDDQPLIRTAITDLVANADGCDVVGEAENGRRAVELARRLHPDVVLMDIRMPEMDGIAATAAICGDQTLADVRVLILTTFEEDAYIVGALRAGASGFLGKGASPAEIIAAIHSVHDGEALLSPTATRTLINRYVQPPAASQGETPPALAELTEREIEILTLVGAGKSNSEIAAELFISPHTAKTHVNRIMAKLGAHDRAQLVISAYETGLIRPTNL